MTSLHERIDFDFDLDEPDHPDHQLPARDPDAPPDVDATQPPRRSFGARIASLWAAVREAAKPPPPAGPTRRHSPPRFSLEFQTSLVDRELRRL
jgi:hypothetical protein